MEDGALSTSNVTRECIERDLKKMGVQNGDHLAVALSFHSLGRMDGGAEAFIDALLQAVGPQGTIMMNTFTGYYATSFLKNPTQCLFDWKTTPANTGHVPETFRHRPEALRSHHPMSSVAAIGKMAEFLTKDHESAPSYSPYSRLGELNGKVLYIGIKERLVAMRHEAQYLAGHYDLVPLDVATYYRDDNGQIRLFARKDVFSCVLCLHKLNSRLREKGLIIEGKIGNADSLILPAKESLNAMAEMLKRDPAVTLCNDISCVWCRELEYKLNLYKEIENPCFFQRNIFAVKILRVINKHRLKGSKAAINTMRLLARCFNNKDKGRNIERKRR
ncbi:MAG: aminoglycoside 3-N-acetyltransferase [Euryarchaeota archaeon]|nr:aminoglycoside 3-N-acetyltransferase [Euryarchaeota archaeon]